MKKSHTGSEVSELTLGLPAESSSDIARCSFYPLAVLDPTVDHTMEVHSPFISALCYSD